MVSTADAMRHTTRAYRLGYRSASVCPPWHWWAQARQMPALLSSGVHVLHTKTAWRAGAWAVWGKEGEGGGSDSGRGMLTGCVCGGGGARTVFTVRVHRSSGVSPTTASPSVISSYGSPRGEESHVGWVSGNRVAGATAAVAAQSRVRGSPVSRPHPPQHHVAALRALQALRALTWGQTRQPLPGCAVLWKRPVPSCSASVETVPGLASAPNALSQAGKGGGSFTESGFVDEKSPKLTHCLMNSSLFFFR